MKKLLLLLSLSSASALLLYLLGRDTWIKVIGLTALISGLLLSGTAVSGDRMRANSQTQPGYAKKNYAYPLLFSLPYLLLLLFG